MAIHYIHILYIYHVQNSKNTINYNKKLILLQYSKNENQKIKISKRNAEKEIV